MRARSPGRVFSKHPCQIDMLPSLAVRLRYVITSARPLVAPLPSAFFCGGASAIIKNKSFASAMGCSTSKMEVSTGSSKDAEDYIEDVVCKDSDLKENEMKAFNLGGEGKVLVVKQNGKLHAVGNRCTHYGAPLDTGALGDGRVRCPWHGACFNLSNGDIEDFPGLDSLPCYHVEVSNGDVKVRARRSDLQANKRSKIMCSEDPREKQHMVIIGGGPAGAICAETLRQEGFSGKITMIAKENCLPYDRIKLSKALDSDIKKLELRTDEYYNTNGIEVLKNVEATNVDVKNMKVTLSDGKEVDFTKVFVATGSTPLKAEIPGADLKGVVVLRTIEDAGKAHELLGKNKDKDVVILGASFIAMEIASYCVGKANKVTVVMRDTVPFKPILGPEIGASVKSLYETKGVNFMSNSGMKACVGDTSGAVKSVELINGEQLKADLVVMGVGSKLNTGLLKSSGVTLSKNGAVEVDEHLKSSNPCIFAGGDIALAPVYTSDNEKVAIGHYGLAQYHGRIAALNMLEKATPVKNIPFFWTMFFGKGIRYAGNGRHDEILYTGNVEELKYAAYYLKGDRVIAMSSCGPEPIVAQYAELRCNGRELYRQDLGEDLLGWTRC